MLFSNCSADRFLKEGQIALSENKLIINGQEKKRDFANQLLFPKNDKRLLISSIKYKLNSWSKESPEQNFKNWIEKKPRRKERLNKIYSKHTGKSVDEISKALERDYFMTAEEAKKFGLIDSVVEKRK